MAEEVTFEQAFGAKSTAPAVQESPVVDAPASGISAGQEVSFEQAFGVKAPAQPAPVVQEAVTPPPAVQQVPPIIPAEPAPTGLPSAASPNLDAGMNAMKKVKGAVASGYDIPPDVYNDIASLIETAKTSPEARSLVAEVPYILRLARATRKTRLVKTQTEKMRSDLENARRKADDVPEKVLGQVSPELAAQSKKQDFSPPVPVAPAESAESTELDVLDDLIKRSEGTQPARDGASQFLPGEYEARQSERGLKDASSELIRQTIESDIYREGTDLVVSKDVADKINFFLKKGYFAPNSLGIKRLNEIYGAKTLKNGKVDKDSYTYRLSLALGKIDLLSRNRDLRLEMRSQRKTKRQIDMDSNELIRKAKGFEKHAQIFQDVIDLPILSKLSDDPWKRTIQKTYSDMDKERSRDAYLKEAGRLRNEAKKLQGPEIRVPTESEIEASEDYPVEVGPAEELARTSIKTLLSAFNPKTLTDAIEAQIDIGTIEYYERKKASGKSLTDKEAADLQSRLFSLSVYEEQLHASDLEPWQKRTIGGNITKGIKELAPYMLSFYLTGGLANASSRTTRRLVHKLGRYVNLHKVIPKSLHKTAKLAGWFSAGTVRTALMGSRWIPEGMKESLPELELTDNGYKIIAMPANDAWKELGKAFVRDLIENLSETSGTMLWNQAKKVWTIPGASKVYNNMFGTLQRKWVTANGSPLAKSIRRGLSKAGYSNIFGESLEERAGDIMRASVGLGKMSTDEEPNPISRIIKEFPSSIEFFEELGVLVVPAGGHVALVAAGAMRQRDAQIKEFSEVSGIAKREVKSILEDEKLRGDIKLFEIEDEALRDEEAKLAIEEAEDRRLESVRTGEPVPIEEDADVVPEDAAIETPTAPVTPTEQPQDAVSPGKGPEMAKDTAEGLGAAKRVIEAAGPAQDYMSDADAEGDGFQEAELHQEAVEAEIEKIAKPDGWDVYGEDGSMGSYYITAELIAKEDGPADTDGDLEWEEGDTIDSIKIRVSNHNAGKRAGENTWSFEVNDDEKMVQMGLDTVAKAIEKKTADATSKLQQPSAPVEPQVASEGVTPEKVAKAPVGAVPEVQPPPPTAPVQATLEGQSKQPAASPSKVVSKKTVTPETATKKKGVAPSFLSDRGKAALDNIIKKLPKPPGPRGGRLTVGIDPSILKDVAILGIEVSKGLAKAAKGGVTSFAEWSTEMVRMIGDSVKPHLGEIWSRVQEDRPTPDAADTIIEDTVGPVPAPSPKDRTTSIKNAIMDDIMETMGEEPPIRGLGASQEGWIGQARDAFEADSNVGENLVRSFIRNPRVPSATDNAIFGYEATRLRLAIKRAQVKFLEATADNNEEAAADAMAEEMKATESLTILANVTAPGGTESSHSLLSRKLLYKDNFTLAAMTRNAKVRLGQTKLNPEQTAEIERLNKEIVRVKRAEEIREAEVAADRVNRAMQREYDSLENEIESEDKRQKKAARKASRTTARSGAKNKLFTVDMKDAALARAKAKMSSLKAGVDVSLMGDWAIVGAFHIEADLRTFGEWSAAIAKDFGSKIKPHLKEVWTKSQELLANERKTQLIKRIAKGEADGRELAQMRHSMLELAKSIMRTGVKGRDNVVNAVHAELQKIMPDVTVKETATVLSGYGIRQELSKDEIDVQLRDYTAQLQQLAKIDDMVAGKPPLKSGPQRQSLSSETRRLTAIVNELKKQGGYIITDPEAQLKSALSAKEARLRNQISDLDYQISTGKRIVRGKSVKLSNPVIEALTQQRNVKQAEFDAVFGEKTRTLTDKQKIALAIKYNEKVQAELKRRKREHDLFPIPKGARILKSAKLDAVKARTAALRQELKELQLLARPKRSPAEVALQARKTRLHNQIADRKERVVNGDYELRSRTIKDRLEDAELRKLQIEDIKVKQEYNRLLFKYQMSQRSTPRKIVDTLVDILGIPRPFLTSFDLPPLGRQGLVMTLSHPVMSIRNAAKALKAVKSKTNRSVIDAGIRTAPNSKYYAMGKIEITERGVELSHMAEEYRSRLVEYIPGVAASERGFSTYANLLRSGAMDIFIDGMGGTLTKNQALVLGNYVNVATGRGSTGFRTIDSALAVSAHAFFAPRLWLSRVQWMTLQPLWSGSYKGTAKARLIIAKEYARVMGAWSVGIGLALLAGATMEDDPDKSDFGKLRIGNTRVDVTAGMASIYTFFHRMASGETTTAYGKTIPIRGKDVPYGGKTQMYFISRHIRGKLAPVPGEILSWLLGENFMGGKPTAWQTAKNLIPPFPVQETKQAIQMEGWRKGIALSFAGLIGMNLGSYRQYAVEAVNAIREGDTYLAQKIATEYNKQKRDDQPFMTIKSVEAKLKRMNGHERNLAISRSAKAWAKDQSVMPQAAVDYNSSLPAGKLKYGQAKITEDDYVDKAAKIKEKLTGVSVDLGRKKKITPSRRRR